MSKLPNQKQATAFNPELVYEASEKDMALAGKQCGACQRRGFPLFLVRKSIVPKTFRPTINWSQGMVSLGEREPQQNWTHYQDVYRTLREGYVYILCHRIGHSDTRQLDIMVYEVTHSGAFRLREFRDVKGSRPKEIPKSCVTAHHHVNALFITIDNKVYDNAWVAYSPVRWTRSSVDYYRQHSAARTQRFSQVDLTQQKAAQVSSQGRSFLFRDFLQKNRLLLELECDNHAVRDYFDDESQPSPQLNKPASTHFPLCDDIRKGIMSAQCRTLDNMLTTTVPTLMDMFNQTFFTANHFNSLHSQAARQALALTVSRYELDTHYGVSELAALVVEDSLGIAEELSVQRRQQLGPVTEGLAEQHEKSDKGLTQYPHRVLNNSHDFIYHQEKSGAKSELARAMQVRGGRDEIADYYQRKAHSIHHYPLSYFTPEVSYARHHYQDIERYKATIKSAITEQGENDAYLFLFYHSSQRSSASYDKNMFIGYKHDERQYGGDSFSLSGEWRY